MRTNHVPALAEAPYQSGRIGVRPYLLILLFVFLATALVAETLTTQGFEASTADTWSYTANPAGMTRLVWWGRSDQPMGGASAQSGNWFWGSWDLDNSEYTLTFANLSLPTGFTHSLSFWYYTNGLAGSDYSKFCVEYDAGDQWNNWVTLNPDIDAWTQMILDIPPYATTVRLKVAAQYNGFSKYAHWDNFVISNVPTPPTAPLVYNTSVQQRTDGSRVVDVYYDIFDANNDLSTVSLLLSSDNGATFQDFPNPANLSGDLGENITNGAGKHIVWNAGGDGIEYDADQYRIRIVAEDNSEPPIPENFVLVAGGTFNNGTSDVTVSSFYLDKYELTQAGYQAVMGIDPASGYGDGANYPVYYVSWFNAIEYCNRRSMQEALNPCYSYSTYGTNPDSWSSGWNTDYLNHTNTSCNWAANGYRLPTEMEWMFAAKGGNLSQGYTYSGSDDINAVAWYHYNSGNTTHIVGTKAPNELGLYDMSGNVWEWCWDIWGSYSSGPQTDPHGATSGFNRVRRGGYWNDQYDYYCSVWNRGDYSATVSNETLGFRICRVSP